MTPPENKLYNLLPAIYRIRDAERGEPLCALLSVIEEQVEGLEEHLSQAYDDQFIETCAEWAVPYIGDLIGYRTLHGVVSKVASRRAEVANTIGYRRRKGTATMLEQLARDVTGWPAHVVEFFELLITTQHLNHIRAHNQATLDLRDWESLERLHSAFETTPHLIDVRRIGTGAGKYHVPNIGIFLWRLMHFPLTDSPAVPEGNDGRRFWFHPLGIDSPLFTRAEAEADITHLAESINVPEPISRRVFDTYLDQYYGPGKSIVLSVNGLTVDATQIHACNLSDLEDGTDWAHVPQFPEHTDIALDPVLGRLAFPTDDPTREVRVSFHYGFSADLGGGEYERLESFEQELDLVQKVTSGQGIQEALDQALDGGTVEIGDGQLLSGRYEELFSITVNGSEDSANGKRLEVRAVNGGRPTIFGPTDDPQDIIISGGHHSEVILNGLLISGARITVPKTPTNHLRQLTLRHCTLVPGLRLHPNGTPMHPQEPSLIVEPDDVTIVLDHCIVGGLQVAERTPVQIHDSVVDATEPFHFACTAIDRDPASNDPLPGGILRIKNSTVIGRVFATSLSEVSNTIFFATMPEVEEGGEEAEPEESTRPRAPVWAKHKQQGCVRFSYVPPGSQVPQQYRCQPALAIDQALSSAAETHAGLIAKNVRSQIIERVQSNMKPSVTSRRYGHPAYCQLRRSTPLGIRSGADDESEMGVFHHLFQPQREKNLQVRLDEYLRVGLEAGVFFSS